LLSYVMKWFAVLVIVFLMLFAVINFINTNMDLNSNVWISVSDISDDDSYKANIRINFKNYSVFSFLYKTELEVYSNSKFLNLEHEDFEFVYYIDGKKHLGDFETIEDGITASIDSHKKSYGYLGFTVTGKNGEYIENIINCYGKMRLSIFSMNIKDYFVYDNFANFKKLDISYHVTNHNVR